MSAQDSTSEPDFNSHKEPFPFWGDQQAGHRNFLSIGNSVPVLQLLKGNQIPWA